jgi:hypothetical protein
VPPSGTGEEVDSRAARRSEDDVPARPAVERVGLAGELAPDLRAMLGRFVDLEAKDGRSGRSLESDDAVGIDPGQNVGGEVVAEPDLDERVPVVPRGSDDGTDGLDDVERVRSWVPARKRVSES